MKINLTIPDELFEKYQSKLGNLMYKHFTDAIVAWQGVDIHDRALVLCSKDRKAIETIFETTIESTERLAKLCKKLVSVQIGPVEVTFTPDELARMQMQAIFHGKSLDQFCHDMAEEIKLRMLEQI